MQFNRSEPIEEGGRITPLRDPNREDGSTRGVMIMDKAEALPKQVGELIKKEIQLARTEMKEKLESFKEASSKLSTGLAVTLLGGFALAMGVVFLLALIMPLWLSALLVGTGLAIVGGTMVAGARKDLSASKLIPEKTLDSLEKNKEILKRNAG